MIRYGLSSLVAIWGCGPCGASKAGKALSDEHTPANSDLNSAPIVVPRPYCPHRDYSLAMRKRVQTSCSSKKLSPVAAAEARQRFHMDGECAKRCTLIWSIQTVTEISPFHFIVFKMNPRVFYSVIYAPVLLLRKALSTSKTRDPYLARDPFPAQSIKTGHSQSTQSGFELTYTISVPF